VKAWRALGRFRRGAPFRPWLLAIVVNEARNRRRQAGRQAALALRSFDPRADDVEGAVSDRSERERVLALVAQMTEEDRMAIGCRYFLDLSEREMAEALAWPRGTVKSRLSRALARLRAAMEAEA
jgi:RNA polymerase sigma factor (sigma-70 family)